MDIDDDQFKTEAEFVAIKIEPGLLDIEPEPTVNKPLDVHVSPTPAPSRPKRKPKPQTSTYPPPLDREIKCEIVRGQNKNTQHQEQLCLDQNRLYNMTGTPTRNVYSWECTNRPLHRCGSQIQTFRLDGKHVAVRDSFLQHGASCDLVMMSRKPTMACDYEQPCSMQISSDGGREEFTAGGYTYHQEYMDEMRFNWVCKNCEAYERCTGSISSTIVAGRHVVLLNTFRPHDCGPPMLKADEDIVEESSNDMDGFKNRLANESVQCRAEQQLRQMGRWN